MGVTRQRVERREGMGRNEQKMGVEKEEMAPGTLHPKQTAAALAPSSPNCQYRHALLSKLKKCIGTWVAQSVKRLTFISGHDLTVREFEPYMGLSAVSAQPALDPLSPSLSAPPLLTLACALSDRKSVV